MIEKKIENLGVMIKSNRKKQGLTQEQLASTSGVGIRFIRELENGKKTCQIGKALVVIQMLGMDIMINGEEL
jgi:y4mF family transcriptional regulator